MPRARWFLGLLVVGLVAAATWHQLSQIRAVLGDARPTRDYVFYEINVQLALEGHQWSGPYSQWFRHPGPSYFYWLAIFYWLGGGTTFSLYAGAQILTAVFVFGMALAVARWAKGLLPLVLFVPLVGLEMAYLGDFPLFDFWPPYVLFLGYGLFLLLCAGIAAGRLIALPPAAAVATLLVQTHVSYAPAVLLGAVITGGYWAWRRPAATSPWIHLGLTGAVLVALWAHTAYVHLFGDTDNLARLHHVFFEMPSRGFTVSALVDRVALEFSGPWQYAFFRDRFIDPGAPKHFGAARVITLLQLALLIAGWRRARRLDDRFAESLSALCVASLGVAAWSVDNIRGEVAPHHTAWISVLGLVAALASASALGSPPIGAPRGRPLVRLTGIAVGWAALSFLWPIRIIPGIHANTEVAKLTRAVRDALESRSVLQSRVEWSDRGPQAVAEYDWATSLMLQLEKQGASFFIHQGAKVRDMIGQARWEGSDPEAPVLRVTVGRHDGADLGEKIACVDGGANYFMEYPVCVWLGTG